MTGIIFYWKDRSWRTTVFSAKANQYGVSFLEVWSVWSSGNSSSWRGNLKKKKAFTLACYLTGSVVEAIANSQKIQPGTCIGIPGRYSRFQVTGVIEGSFGFGLFLDQTEALWAETKLFLGPPLISGSGWLPPPLP